MTEMRTFDIPYVKNGYVPPVTSVPLEEMTLQDITKKYLRSCHKSNGLVSACRDCVQQCVYGEKAVELTFGRKRTEGTGAYEGSLLQQARLANEQKRIEEKKAEEKKEEPKEQAKETKKRRYNQDPEGWFEEAMAQPDPIKYVMDRFGKTKTQAKKKIYMYRYLHKPDKDGEEKTPEMQVNASSVVDAKPAETPSETAQPEEKPTDIKTASDDDLLKQMMDRKLELLMNQQEQIESEIKACQTKLTKVKEQIETICKTMDILKEV